MIRYIGPLTWAYAILIGGMLLITPEGIDPIVFRVAGGVSASLGMVALLLSASTPATSRG